MFRNRNHHTRKQGRQNQIQSLVCCACWQHKTNNTNLLFRDGLCVFGFWLRIITLELCYRVWGMIVELGQCSGAEPGFVAALKASVVTGQCFLNLWWSRKSSWSSGHGLQPKQAMYGVGPAPVSRNICTWTPHHPSHTSFQWGKECVMSVESPLIIMLCIYNNTPNKLG